MVSKYRKATKQNQLFLVILSFFFLDVTLLHLKPQAQKQFLKHVCLQRVFEHVCRLFFFFFKILMLMLLSKLKSLHKIPLSFTFIKLTSCTLEVH